MYLLWVFYQITINRITVEKQQNENKNHKCEIHWPQNCQPKRNTYIYNLVIHFMLTTILIMNWILKLLEFATNSSTIWCLILQKDNSYILCTVAVNHAALNINNNKIGCWMNLDIFMMIDVNQHQTFLGHFCSLQWML